MSCVMGNRLILNVRHLHKEITGSAPADASRENFEPTRDQDESGDGSSRCDSGHFGSEDVWSTELRTTCVHYGVAV
jgi:hypothetical protein